MENKKKGQTWEWIDIKVYYIDVKVIMDKCGEFKNRNWGWNMGNGGHKKWGNVRLNLIILIRHFIDAKWTWKLSQMNMWQIQKGVDMKMWEYSERR